MKTKTKRKNHKCDCYKYEKRVCEDCQGPSKPDKKGDPRKPLTFQQFHEVNVARSNVSIKHSWEWSAMEWGCALSGEVGELCNYLKKLSRGDKIEKEALAHEIADIMTYLSLLANHLDIDLESAIIKKFNIVSDRWGTDKFRL